MCLCPYLLCAPSYLVVLPLIKAGCHPFRKLCWCDLGATPVPSAPVSWLANGQILRAPGGGPEHSRHSWDPRALKERGAQVAQRQTECFLSQERQQFLLPARALWWWAALPRGQWWGRWAQPLVPGSSRQVSVSVEAGQWKEGREPGLWALGSSPFHPPPHWLCCHPGKPSGPWDRCPAPGRRGPGLHIPGYKRGRGIFSAGWMNR